MRKVWRKIDRLLEPIMDLLNETGSKLLACIVHGAKDKTPELYKHYAETLNSIGERTLARGWVYDMNLIFRGTFQVI